MALKLNVVTSNGHILTFIFLLELSRGSVSHLHPPVEALGRKRSGGRIYFMKKQLLGGFLLEDLLVQYAVTSWEALTRTGSDWLAGQEGQLCPGPKLDSVEDMWEEAGGKANFHHGQHHSATALIKT